MVHKSEKYIFFYESKSFITVIQTTTRLTGKVKDLVLSAYCPEIPLSRAVTTGNLDTLVTGWRLIVCY